MKNLKWIVSVLSFSMGLAGGSQAASLNGPDSLGFSTDTQPSLYGMQFAAASKSKKHHDADSAEGTSLFEDGSLFIEARTGYDFAFLGDINTGTNQWISYLKTIGGVTSTGGGNNSGLAAGVLAGLNLDKSSSLALDLGSVFDLGNNWTVTATGTSVNQNCSPNLLSASLDYILNIVQGPSSRTYLTAGAGYYHTDVSYSLNFPGNIYSGTWSGDTVGGTLGLGEEISLGGALGLDFSIRGRYASFNKVSNGSVTALGGASGSSSLAILSASSGGATYNILVPVYDSQIGTATNSRDAVVDYSGIEAKAALKLFLN